MSDTTDLRDLDIQIAKALGYHIHDARANPDNPFSTVDRRYWLTDPDGRSSAVGYAVIADAWRWGGLPGFSSDLNAAARLPLPDDMHLEIRVYLDGVTHVSIIHNTFMGAASPDAVATTEAEARARAWLAWHEATQKTNAGSLLSESEG